MRVFGTLLFSEAIAKQAGDYLAKGGIARRILAVVREGKDEPYFQLEGVDAGDWTCADKPGLISWQVLGDAR